MKPIRWISGIAFVLVTGSAQAAAPDTEAIEFFNATTGHFFITASALEASMIDGGSAGAGWVRTGRSFQAWLSQAAAPADAQPVCRFYSQGANSHFYTAGAGECASLKAMEAQERAASATVRGWQFEGVAFFIGTPKAGQCAAGSTELTRVYNDGFANGQGANHRFVDDAALQALMEDRAWLVEGPAFCAVAKSTGTNANLPPTTASFTDLVGTWKGSGEWEIETAAGETEAGHPLQLTFAADGSVTGNGNGCTFAGKIATGDGFRSLFSGALSATGCTDPAFNGDYRRFNVERFGSMLLARMKIGDGPTEASISARLASDAATPAPTPAPTPPPVGFDRIAGDWMGTVQWEVEASGQPQVESNKALAVSISGAGALTGSGFGCTLAGTLQSTAAGFTGTVTASGCDNTAFNGSFDRVQVQRDGSRLEIRFQRESAAAEVKIAGELSAKDAAPPPVPVPAVGNTLPGSWQGTLRWVASQSSSGKDSSTTVDAMEAFSFTIGADGTFTGSGFGCTFTGNLALTLGGRAAGAGTLAATGCTRDAFNGSYASPRFSLEDASLEVELQREAVSGGTRVRTKISGKARRS